MDTLNLNLLVKFLFTKSYGEKSKEENCYFFRNELYFKKIEYLFIFRTEPWTEKQLQKKEK